ncbi:MAG: YraN family protein [Clostridia bacterium]|nr:YraN family protein [Clostridia bacterium]
MTKERIILGFQGEEAACKYLLQHGYEIVTRNYRCKLGEMDVVARDGDTLVFVEVRTRGTNSFGIAEESVDWRKQQRLRKIAQYYLVSEHKKEVDCRFDVVTVNFGGAVNITEQIKHYQGAF